MINLELELRKCRERTKDESVVKLMMQAKVDVLDDLAMDEDCETCGQVQRSRDELFWWVQRQTIQANEQREIAEAARILPKKSAAKRRKGASASQCLTPEPRP